MARDISGDEQTIGFQGRHSDKLRITYKAEGDGFQCDAICDTGYTWTFFFRNMPAPQKWICLGYLPLHSRILAMFDQLEEKNHNCWFANLYLSAKFSKSIFHAQEQGAHLWTYEEEREGTAPVCSARREDVPI